jgi:hypothetical protein
VIPITLAVPSSLPSPRRSRALLATVVALWLSTVAVGFVRLRSYQSQPGVSASSTSRWPEHCAIERRPNLPTLLVFAHPQCPCTRATISELERVAASCVDRLQIVVAFLELPELGEQWTRTDLWNSAAAIPGVEVRADRDGALARSFHAETSGQTLLFDAAGRLVFEGGITGSRGHAGDNAGEDAVVAFAHGTSPECAATPVFGCRLF